MKKKILGVGTFLIILLLIITNLPLGISFTPTQNLDPTEGTGGATNAPWYFRYGHSSSYGAYARDVRWDSVGNTANGVQLRYIGMASVPWVKLDGTKYSLPRGTIQTKTLTPIGSSGHLLDFHYSFPDSGSPSITHDLHIYFEFLHATGPGNGYGKIVIEGKFDSTSNEDIEFEMACRVDFDIIGQQSPGNDKAYIYEDNPNPPPDEAWFFKSNELTYTDGDPRCPTNNLKVVQEDNSVSGPNAGIEPRAGEHDILIILKYKPNEFTGDPGDYENNEDINIEDIVIWVETGDAEVWDSITSIAVTIDTILWLE